MSFKFNKNVPLPNFIFILSLTIFCKIHLPNAFADKEARPFNNPAEQRAWNQRTQKFERLWLNRPQRKVTPQLLQMLAAEPTPYLREHIVIALGRIEDPLSIKPLEVLLKQTTPASEQQSKDWREKIPPFRVRLAIGRIRARKLHGEAKLNKIASSIGQNWTGIQRIAAKLRSQLRDRMGIYKAQRSDDYLVVEEFYDVLYRMGKHKEDISRLGSDKVLLWPQHAPFLETGSLSDAAEVQFWLKRAVPPSKVSFAPAHLLDLGPTVESALWRHLQTLLVKAQSDPKSFAGTRAYLTTFQAVAQTRNRKYLPVLRKFLKVNDRWTRNYAEDAIRQLEKGEGVITFP